MPHHEKEALGEIAIVECCKSRLFDLTRSNEK